MPIENLFTLEKQANIFISVYNYRKQIKIFKWFLLNEMSLHTELLRTKEVYYKQDLETLTVDQNASPDKKLIVKEIINEILDNAISAPVVDVDGTEEECDDNLIKLTNSCTGISEDFIDLTRNYKEEFRSILHNLKCRSILEQKSSNPTLEEQITCVIQDIQNLEAAIRKNDLKIHIDNTLNSSDNMNLNVVSNNNHYISEKSGVTDMFKNTADNKPESQLSVEDSNEEIILQVIELQVPTDELINYNEIKIDSPTVFYEVLEKHRNNLSDNETILSSENLEEDKTIKSKNSIKELDNANTDRLSEEKKANKKKTWFGQRVMKFFRNMSKHKTRNTETPIDQM